MKKLLLLALALTAIACGKCKDEDVIYAPPNFTPEQCAPYCKSVGAVAYRTHPITGECQCLFFKRGHNWKNY